MTIESYGISHIQLAVSDLDRSTRFYAAILGGEIRQRDDDGAFVGTADGHDILTLALDREKKQPLGTMGSIAHFGFRLKKREHFDAALAAAEQTGGTLIRRGERGPHKNPWAFVSDPDGYKVEIFFEA